MNIRHIAALLFVLLMWSITGCRPTAKETVDLDITRQDIIYYFDLYIPQVMPVRADTRRQILNNYLVKLDQYQAIDTAVPVHYFVDQMIDLSLSLVTEDFIPGPRQQIFLEKAEDMFYDMAKDNHLKTHTNLNEFPDTHQAFMQWVAEIWVQRTGLVQQAARAGALFQRLEREGAIDAATVEELQKMVDHDITYFTGKNFDNSRKKQGPLDTSGLSLLEKLDPDSRRELNEIYEEIILLAQKEIKVPQTGHPIPLYANLDAYNPEELSHTYFTYLYDQVGTGQLPEEQFMLIAGIIEEDMEFMHNLLISPEDLKNRILNRFQQFEETQLPLVEKELLANLYYTAGAENGVNLLPEIQAWLEKQ